MIYVGGLTHCDAVVIGISDDLVFDLLPALQALVNQYLEMKGTQRT